MLKLFAQNMVSEGGATRFCRVQDTLYLWKAIVIQNLVGRSLLFWNGKLELISRNTVSFGRSSLMLQKRPKPHLRYQMLCVAFSALWHMSFELDAESLATCMGMFFCPQQQYCYPLGK